MFKLSIVFLISLCTCLLHAASSQAFKPADEMLKAKMNTKLLKCEGKITGEGVCWHAAYRGHEFVHAYKATKDLSYLRAGQTYYDALISQMYTSPDGYKGWVGPYIGKGSVKIADCHVGDAILCAIFLAHAEIVLVDKTLDKEFGDRARSYVELVKTHLIEKWHARGTWWQNGPYGGYRVFDKFLTQENMAEFQTSHQPINSVGYQLNKQLDMAVCHLRLYRITGDLKQREYARLIYNHGKSRLNLYDDHYAWNYWEPFYPVDIVNNKELLMWVATHPYRNYQAGEVKNFVEAFHSGLTFDATDIKRLIKTNLHMWNNDLEKPRFKNSNDEAVTAATGKAKDFVESKAYPNKAGCLWTSLCEFSPELAAINKSVANNSEIKRAYPHLPVDVLEVPFSSSANINMACVIPASAKKGTLIKLISKFRSEKDCRIDLCDKNGKVLQNIFTGAHPGGNDGREGILIKNWVINVSYGQYRIRWTAGEEHRDYYIWVQ